MGTRKKTGAGAIDLTKKYICMECSCQRDPIWVNRGWLFIEIMMWLLYILPGVIYSIWRRVRKQQVCPNCLNPTMVLTTSSRVMKARQVMSTVLKGASLPGDSPIPGQEKTVKQPASPISPAGKAGRQDYQEILKNAQRRGKIAKGQQSPIHFKFPENKKNKK